MALDLRNIHDIESYQGWHCGEGHFASGQQWAWPYQTRLELQQDLRGSCSAVEKIGQDRHIRTSTSRINSNQSTSSNIITRRCIFLKKNYMILERRLPKYCKMIQKVRSHSGADSSMALRPACLLDLNTLLQLWYLASDLMIETKQMFSRLLLPLSISISIWRYSTNTFWNQDRFYTLDADALEARKSSWEMGGDTVWNFEPSDAAKAGERCCSVGLGCKAPVSGWVWGPITYFALNNRCKKIFNYHEVCKFEFVRCIAKDFLSLFRIALSAMIFGTFH